MSNKMICQLEHKEFHIVMVLLFLVFALLSACGPQEIELPFETIEQKREAGTGQAYEAREPGLMIIAQSKETSAVNDWITKDAKTYLQGMNYDTYFALIVFQGQKPTDGYSIRVERVTRYGSQVTVYVQLEEPQPDKKKNDIVTSPYHLIQVQKVGTWDEAIMFNVVTNKAVIASTSHHIP